MTYFHVSVFHANYLSDTYKSKVLFYFTIFILLNLNKLRFKRCDRKITAVIFIKKNAS